MSTIATVPLSTLASQINSEHAACMASAQEAVSHAIEVGRLLIECKAEVAHGQWAVWVENNCEFGVRQAQNYMRVYHNRAQLEAQMRNGDSCFTSLRGAVAALVEPRADLLNEAIIQAGLTEVLILVCNDEWPAGDTLEEKIINAKLLKDAALEVFNLAVERKLRLERAMGELLNEMEADRAAAK
jgi:Protein of unknown function (DUF3102)